MATRHLAVAVREEHLEVVARDAIPVDRDTATHHVVCHVGELMRSRDAIAGSLERIGRRHQLDEPLSGAIDRTGDQLERVRGGVEQPPERNDRRLVLCNVAHDVPGDRVAGSDVQ